MKHEMFEGVFTMKNLFRKRIETYACQNDVVVNFYERNDSSVISEEYFYYKEFPFEDVPFLQSYIIDDSIILSVCTFDVDLDLDDEECISDLSSLFCRQYGPSIKYDKGTKQLVVSYSFDLCEDVNESDIAYILFIPSIVCRMFICALHQMITEGVSAKDAFNDVESLEDKFLNVEEISYYFSKAVGYATEGKIRYFIEHVRMRDEFFDDPEFFINSVINNEADFISQVTDENLELYDLPGIPDYDKFSVASVIDNEEITCVRIKMPKAVDTFDCSDLVLLYGSDGKALYYTVELERDESGRRNYFPCCWSGNGEHYNFGMNNTRDSALNVIMDRIRVGMSA